MSHHVEQRGSERATFHALARVSDGCIETPATSVDASAAGIGLASAFLWQPGTRVTVQVLLTDETVAVARAVVQRTEGDRMGLRLVSQSPRFSKLVRSLGQAA